MKLRTTSTKIDRLLQQATLNRRPLLLHNHRPLAIKTSIPKFEDSYNPTKHYDPDRERAELSKLKAEHKRERKGALRELRKDANFIARESLREKKERDKAYETKYKRLVAEIQGEEGKEANAYEREKRLRKGRR
jgi:nucleolar protein 14